jgi:hypothetical protein
LKPFSRAEYMRMLEANAKAQKEQSKSANLDWKPCNAAEYLFSNEHGELLEDINPVEAD